MLRRLPSSIHGCVVVMMIGMVVMVKRLRWIQMFVLEPVAAVALLLLVMRVLSNPTVFGVVCYC